MTAANGASTPSDAGCSRACSDDCQGTWPTKTEQPRRSFHVRGCPNDPGRSSTPIKRPRWRLRLAMWIYPWWTQDGVDAVKWRAHVKRREMGFVRCVEAEDVANDANSHAPADECLCSRCVARAAKPEGGAR